ncbi:MAG: ATP-binding protein, partial [Methanosarcinales archaeon]|nr:ATP-binding protein [Methanosarcinales archaeon]
PQMVISILQSIQTFPNTFPNNSYVESYGDFPQDFIISLPYYNETVYKMCLSLYVKAVKSGWGVSGHYYVSTRGGEERGEYYVLSDEIMTAINDFTVVRIQKEFDPQINKIKDKLYALKFLFHYNPDSYNGLGRYSVVEGSIIEYLTGLKETINTSKDLFTSGFTSQMPFMIMDADAYKTRIRKFEKELNEQLTNLFSIKDNQTMKIKVIDSSTKEKKEEEPKEDQNQKEKPPLKPITELHEPSTKTDLQIFLGYDGNREVYWLPKEENSWNFIIVGSAGTGKTQTVRAIIKAFDNNNIPYLVFDFREDYCLKKESQFGQVLDLASISINPLEIEGENSPKDQKYQISDIIDLIYKIGPKQIGFIRESIKKSYENKGIYENNPESWNNFPPTFNDIQNYLNQKSKEGTSPEKNAIQGIFSRLDPIFDYDVFSPETTIKFEDILKSNTIINLSKLPNDNIKSIVCEFFLRKLRYYLYEKGSSREPILYVIIDEAHRLKYDKKSSIGQLLKEARKYGVGVVLSTQDPVDFTNLVYNNVGGILTLQITDPKYAKNIAQHLGGDVDWKFVKNKLSDKFSACVKFSRRDQNIKFKVMPHYEREQN